MNRRLCLCLVLLQLFYARLIAGTDFPKGCLVEARAFQALSAAGVWSRLVRLSSPPSDDGHGVCVYALKNGALWVYDCNTGSRDLFTTEQSMAAIKTALHRYYVFLACDILDNE